MIRLLVLLSLTLGCAERRTSSDDYQDFRDRTAGQRAAATCERAVAFQSQPSDIRGRWVVRNLLPGGINLGLRLEIQWAEGEDGTAPVEQVVRFWLMDQDPETDPPLLETPATMDAAGTFTLVAQPLSLGADLLNTANPVEADVQLHSLVQDGAAWCGTMTGRVTSPLELGLEGSTFAALRDDEQLSVLEEMPFACPMTECGEAFEVDVGVEGDGGVSDEGVPRPATPDLSEFESQRLDVTGDWLLAASLGGLPLQLWVGLLYHEAEGPGPDGIDGIIRLTRDEVVSPPRVIFDTTMNADGQFDVWLPGFYLDTGVIVVEGDILLSAVAVEAGIWCGRGAGVVTAPFPIDLTDATFAAVPWVPGSELPENEDILRACP